MTKKVSLETLKSVLGRSILHYSFHNELNCFLKLPFLALLRFVSSFKISSREKFLNWNMPEKLMLSLLNNFTHQRSYRIFEFLRQLDWLIVLAHH